MQVQKRDGSFQSVQFDKITERIKTFCNDLDIDPVGVAQQVISRLTDKITTEELDKLACDYCASLALENSDYLQLAASIKKNKRLQKIKTQLRSYLSMVKYIVKQETLMVILTPNSQTQKTETSPSNQHLLA